MNKQTLLRIYPRVEPHQFTFIKRKSKKEKKGEAEVIREMLEYYINQHK